MAREQDSEYGGVSGMIQPRTRGHETLTPAEEAMVLRRAGLKEGGGILISRTETRRDDGLIDIEIEPYTEEQAQRDLGWTVDR